MNELISLEKIAQWGRGLHRKDALIRWQGSGVCGSAVCFTGDSSRDLRHLESSHCGTPQGCDPRESQTLASQM
jgi:hypothetical protein